LPDDFEEKYPSSEAYYREQEEREKAEAALKAALEAAEQEKKERHEAELRILRAFFTNDKYCNIISYIKDFGGYFEIYSSKPYDEAYIVWRLSEDNEYSYTIWRLSVQDKKCVLINAYLDDVTETYRNIATFTGDYDSFVTMYIDYVLYSDDELINEGIIYYSFNQ
jgi:hypothetical protein